MTLDEALFLKKLVNGCEFIVIINGTMITEADLKINMHNKRPAWWSGGITEPVIDFNSFDYIDLYHDEIDYKIVEIVSKIGINPATPKKVIASLYSRGGII